MTFTCVNKTDICNISLNASYNFPMYCADSESGETPWPKGHFEKRILLRIVDEMNLDGL